ncbi:MAG TPA: response regulator [Terriglobales bacterium]|nr:response regulator [Terriglobales bacterium]
MPGKMTVLLIDDDPSHLKLYSWVVDKGGYRTLTALVKGNSVALPRDEQVDLTVLDYRIGTTITAVEVARQLAATFPKKPILVLSDLPWMPDDIAPYAAAFVRKGEPEQMLQTIEKLIAA